MVRVGRKMLRGDYGTVLTAAKVKGESVGEDEIDFQMVLDMSTGTFHRTHAERLMYDK